MTIAKPNTSYFPESQNAFRLTSERFFLTLANNGACSWRTTVYGLQKCLAPALPARVAPDLNAPRTYGFGNNRRWHAKSWQFGHIAERGITQPVLYREVGPVVSDFLPPVFSWTDVCLAQLPHYAKFGLPCPRSQAHHSRARVMIPKRRAATATGIRPYGIGGADKPLSCYWNDLLNGFDPNAYGYGQAERARSDPK